MMSIVPARAQYSFFQVFGTVDDDRPTGMLQVKDGGFVFYGTSWGWNYIAKVDHFGQMVWQLHYNPNSQGDWIHDMVELYDGTLLAGGEAGWQMQSVNPRLTCITPDGSIVFDSIYRLNARTSGDIMKMVHSKPDRQIISIGVGALSINQYALYFQKTDYQGKRLWQKQIPIHESFRFKDFYKHAQKEEYLVFAEKFLMHLDSLGNQIGQEKIIVDDFSGDYILDVVQLGGNGFAVLVNGRSGGYIRYHDLSGMPLAKKIILPKGDGFGFGAINATKDKGFIVAGTHLLLLDSNEQTIWMKHILRGDTAGVSTVAQATDGGFYGCGLSLGNFEERNYDMFVFKATADGEVRTGIHEQATNRLNVSVWPNPSAGVFTITGQFKRAHISVTNLLGQMVIEPQLIVAGGAFDASSLPEGVYLLTVTDSNTTHVRKIHIIK